MNKATTKSLKKSAPVVYQNNPFFVATDGIDRLFKKAMPIGILFAILSFVFLVSYLPGSFSPPQTMAPADQSMRNDTATTPVENRQPENRVAETPANTQNDKLFNNNSANGLAIVLFSIGALFVLAIIGVMVFIGIVIKGISDYTAAHLARGEEVGLGQAFRGVFGSFWGYVWVQVLVGIKIFLWSLLLIVPGIIMAVRYSLAGISYFDEKGRGNAAIKDSLVLTKGAWLTTFSSHTLFNLITFGVIQTLLKPGTDSILYGQYRGLSDSGERKPKAHPLAWVTLVLVLFVAGIFLALISLMIWAIVNYSFSTAP